MLEKINSLGERKTITKDHKDVNGVDKIMQFLMHVNAMNLG